MAIDAIKSNKGGYSSSYQCATTSSNETQKTTKGKQSMNLSIRIAACSAGGNDDDPNRKNNFNNSKNGNCGSVSSSDSDSDDGESSTKSWEERERSRVARKKNKKRSLEQRLQKSIAKFFRRLINSNRDKRAGGTYRVLMGFTSYSGGTIENNHIPASSCLIDTIFSSLSKQLQLVISMFTEHHRDYPSTGNSHEAVAFRKYHTNLIINEGFACGLEFEMIVFFASGLFLLYTFGWYDLLLKAFRINLISKEDVVRLLTKLKSFIQLIVDLFDNGIDFDKIVVDPKIFIDSTTVLSMVMSFTNLDIIRNLQKFYEAYIKANGSSAGFIEVLKQYIKEIGIAIALILLKMSKK